jgi:hypothetical protein
VAVSSSGPFGVMKFLVNDPDLAYQALKHEGFVAKLVDALAVEVPDKPGGLAQVLSFLEQEKINVEYMYAFLEHRSDDAIIIFRFDDNDSAIHVLSAHGVKIVSGKKVYEM